jgi:hypothetical protein
MSLSASQNRSDSRIRIGRIMRALVKCAALVCAACLFWVVLVIAGGMYMEFVLPMTVDSEYADRADAETNTLFNRGWMPRDMPATMNNIRIRTNVDFGHAWATFQTDQNGVDTIRERYEAVSPDKVFEPGKSQVDWWPDNLKTESDLDETHLELFSCGRRSGFKEDAYLALDPETFQVYYWTK